MRPQLLVSLVMMPVIFDNIPDDFFCLFIFSHNCIIKSLSQTPKCPVCKTNLTHDGGFAPNFSCKFSISALATAVL